MLATLALAAALACPAAHGDARQLVTVVAAPRANTASLRLWRRSGECWVPVTRTWTARVGRNGLSANHREGDGTTPLGTFRFGSTMYGVAADPGVRYRYHRIVCGDWWDEDPFSTLYNRFRHVDCGAQGDFGEGSEALWRSPEPYRYLAVIDYNARGAFKRGSGIFLATDVGHPTHGGVSLPASRLVRVLRWLDPAKHPRIRIRISRSRG